MEGINGGVYGGDSLPSGLKLLSFSKTWRKKQYSIYTFNVGLNCDNRREEGESLGSYPIDLGEYTVSINVTSEHSSRMTSHTPTYHSYIPHAVSYTYCILLFHLGEA